MASIPPITAAASNLLQAKRIMPLSKQRGDRLQVTASARSQAGEGGAPPASSRYQAWQYTAGFVGSVVDATTVPVPAWPGLAWDPGSVLVPPISSGVPPVGDPSWRIEPGSIQPM